VCVCARARTRKPVPLFSSFVYKQKKKPLFSQRRKARTGRIHVAWPTRSGGDFHAESPVCRSTTALGDVNHRRRPREKNRTLSRHKRSVRSRPPRNRSTEANFRYACNVRADVGRKCWRFTRARVTRNIRRALTLAHRPSSAIFVFPNVPSVIGRPYWRTILCVCKRRVSVLKATKLEIWERFDEILDDKHTSKSPYVVRNRKKTAR